MPEMSRGFELIFCMVIENQESLMLFNNSGMGVVKIVDSVLGQVLLKPAVSKEWIYELS